MVGNAMTGTNPTVNPGDRIAKEPQTIEEKSKQVAVDLHDITGAPVKVPTYFIFKYPDGETKALHHVKDAQEISDAIRQMRFYEEDWEQEVEKAPQRSNLNGLLLILGVSILALLLMTMTVLIGIF
ncbi:MAG: hypothetical protein AB4426_33380 [Xenococcaceae cyanobacterium]